MDKYTIFYNGGNKLTFNVSNFAVTTDGKTAFQCTDFRNLLITVVGTGNVKIYGSCQKTPPNFSSPSTITNSYVPIVLADYSTPNTYYAGSAGVSVTADTAIVELNTNLLTWIAIERSLNTVEVLLTETNNQ